MATLPVKPFIEQRSREGLPWMICIKINLFLGTRKSSQLNIWFLIQIWNKDDDAAFVHLLALQKKKRTPRQKIPGNVRCLALLCVRHMSQSIIQTVGISRL